MESTSNLRPVYGHSNYQARDVPNNKSLHVWSDSSNGSGDWPLSQDHTLVYAMDTIQKTTNIEVAS